MARYLALLTLLALLGCGRDDILVAADAGAAAKTPGGPSAAPDEGAPGTGPSTVGIPLNPAISASATPGSPDTLGLAAAPTPGIPGSPGSPTPGIPGSPGSPAPGIPGSPGSNPAPPGTPQPNAGPQVTISGAVVFSTYKAGSIRVTVFDGDHSKPSTSPPRVLGMVEVQGPGPFAVDVPENAGKVYIEGSIDEDGDGRPGPQEPAGKADRYPLTIVTTPVDGVSVELDRIAPPPSGERKDDF